MPPVVGRCHKNKLSILLQSLELQKYAINKYNWNHWKLQRKLKTFSGKGNKILIIRC